MINQWLLIENELFNTDSTFLLVFSSIIKWAILIKQKCHLDLSLNPNY